MILHVFPFPFLASSLSLFPWDPSLHPILLSNFSWLYRYIGGWGVSPAGPPVTGKSFRVVPCVRTCVRVVLGLVRFQAKRRSCSFPFPLWPRWFFPFPFYRGGFSLFPYEHMFPFPLWATCSYDFYNSCDFHCGIKWLHMKPNDIKWTQMKSIKTIETQTNSSDKKWNQYLIGVKSS